MSVLGLLRRRPAVGLTAIILLGLGGGGFAVIDSDGRKVLDVAVAMGTVYAGTSTPLEGQRPDSLRPGRYLASLRLPDSTEHVVVLSRPLAIQMAPVEPLPPPAPGGGTQPAPGGGVEWMLWFILALWPGLAIAAVWTAFNLPRRHGPGRVGR